MRRNVVKSTDPFHSTAFAAVDVPIQWALEEIKLVQDKILVYPVSNSFRPVAFIPSKHVVIMLDLLRKNNPGEATVVKIRGQDGKSINQKIKSKIFLNKIFQNYSLEKYRIFFLPDIV